MENRKKENGICLDEVSHVIVPKDQLKEKLVECDMCGYHNPSGTKICKNCSNYLEK